MLVWLVGGTGRGVKEMLVQSEGGDRNLGTLESIGIKIMAIYVPKSSLLSINNGEMHQNGIQHHAPAIWSWLLSV